MKNLKNQLGQMFILTLITLAVVTIGTLAVISGSLTFKQNSKYSVDQVEVVSLAEAGVDKAIASLNVSGGQYNGEKDTSLGTGTYSVKITPIDAGTSLVEATGYIPNSTKPKTQKTIKIQISKGTGISFVYGMLVGNGGISMGNNSQINGSVYTNGSITSGNNQTITGDAYVAGGTQPTADQISDCTSCGDFIFGKSVGGNTQLDVAQSFKPSTSQNIGKISLKLKKFGSPPNVTVRLLKDASGKPDKSNVLASGTLYANLVTNAYGYIDVTFTTTPALTAGTTYWIVIDTNSDNSNYWSWSEDTLQQYTNGSASWSPNWQASNPTWNSIQADLGFKTYMGGVVTGISMGSGSKINGNVHAHVINGVTVGKDAYYQILTNSTVNGQSYPGSPDPPPIAMPISDANIADWKQTAESAGTQGNVNGCPANLGPGKISGNLNSSSNCTITVKTPIWITGNLALGNNAILKLSSTYGATSGIIVVDGTVSFANDDDLKGSGTSGSYLTMLSTYDTQVLGGNAINTGNSSITGILYAPYGQIALANNANFKEAVGWKITAGNDTILTYDSGLISTFFSSGPTGSFSVIKGTYQIK